jgi:hypothetical protein
MTTSLHAIDVVKAKRTAPQQVGHCSRRHIDRVIHEEGERLQRAFPWLDERSQLRAGRK